MSAKASPIVYVHIVQCPRFRNIGLNLCTHIIRIITADRQVEKRWLHRDIVHFEMMLYSECCATMGSVLRYRHITTHGRIEIAMNTALLASNSMPPAEYRK